MQQALVACHASLYAPSARPFAPSVRRVGRCKPLRPAAGLLETVLKPITSGGKALPLKDGIAKLYDESSGLWESMWGEHLHHGYYGAEEGTKSNAQAQIDMVDNVLDWAGVQSVKKVVDVGCGLGGSSRHILDRYPGSEARGITLSPVQADRANVMTREAGLGDRAEFQVADALSQPFPDGSFDLVWSLESGEHMPEKETFVRELARVALPGGRIIIVTWCHRNLAPGETALTPEEQTLLDRLCEAYYLPAWCSLADYERLFAAHGIRDVKTADWSVEVQPFWGQVIKSALTTQGVTGLLKAGWTTIKGALVMPLMARGLSMGLIKFVLITGVKAET
ncbi:VTE4 [Auxenochlorella protothecoides x Auxenochlorella symbiontica]